MGTQNSDTIVIRSLWAADSGHFRDHLLRLDSESRHLRFGMGVGDHFLRDYAERAFTHDGVVFGGFDGEHLRAVAELRPFGGLLPRDAEAAFSVERPCRDQGVATRLLGRVILAARNRSIQTLYMNCLASNRAMQKVAGKHGADLRFEEGSVIGEIIAPRPTYFSLWREAMEENHGFVMAVLDLNTGSRNAA